MESLMKNLSTVVLFASVYTILHLSSSPSLPGGDSGELMAVSCQLGIAHPPGYPLYTVLSYFWINFPLPLPRLLLESSTWSASLVASPTTAWRVNNMCCFLSSFTAVFIKCISEDLLTAKDGSSLSSTGPMVSSILFILSPLVWEYSNAGEVFALNNFLCAGLLLLTSRILRIVFTLPENPQAAGQSAVQSAATSASQSAMARLDCYVYTGALLSALALTNQHASFFLVAVLIVAVIVATARLKTTLSFLYISSAVFTMGLSPYLYLVYSHAHPRRGSWGDMGSLWGLLTHVLRMEYGTFRLGFVKSNVNENILVRILLSMEHTSREMFHIMWPLLFVGLFWIIALSDLSGLGTVEAKKASSSSKAKAKHHSVVKAGGDGSSRPCEANRLLYFTILFSLVFYHVSWHGVLSNLPLENAPMAYAVHARFWMQPMMLTAVLASVGIAALEQRGWSASCGAVEVGSLALMLSFVLHHRWGLMDKSAGGWTMHRYGEGLLAGLPKDALLLAHTDLDLNAVRYLRECEGSRPDLTHLTFQLMPYPWFYKIQAPMYPNVSFVPPFQGISTNRRDDANAFLVTQFLRQNMEGFPAVFLDMQSMNDVEVGNVGQWRGFTLVPYGCLYRVLPPMAVQDTARLHMASVKRLRSLLTSLPAMDSKFFSVYPPGSWEHAVASVVTDAQYQLGLFLLTYAIETQKAVSQDNLLLIVDRYHMAATLLTEAAQRAKLPLAATKTAVTTFENSHMFRSERQSSEPKTGLIAFSGIRKDLEKNAALAWMRLCTVGKVLPGLRVALYKMMEDKSVRKQLLSKDILDVMTSPGRAEGILLGARMAIGSFISAYPDDSDVAVFRKELTGIEAAIESSRAIQQHDDASTSSDQP